MRTTRTILAGGLLAFLLGLMVQTPVSSQSTMDRLVLRKSVTRWMRARQGVLIKCEECLGRGYRNVTTLGPQGLTTVQVPHQICGKTGVMVRRRMLSELFRPYLEDATTFPGLGCDKRLTVEDIRDILEQEEVEPRTIRRQLKRELGLVRRSAQVRKMEFHEPEGGYLFATVTITVAPYKTEWVRIENRWYIVSPEDVSVLLEDQGQDGSG